MTSQMSLRPRLAASSACFTLALLSAVARADDAGIDAGELPEAGSFPEAGIVDAAPPPDAASFPDAGGTTTGPDAAAFPDASKADAQSEGGTGVDAGPYPIADAGTPDALLAKPCADWIDPLACMFGEPMLFEKTVKLPIAFDWDTGWIPNGSPVQVRFYVKLPAQTHVRMLGGLQATWPKSVSIVVPGARKTGVIDFDYGLEVGAKAKVSVSIFGQNIGWEGDIPYLPNVDFHVQGKKGFDPWAWKPGATASGLTPKLTLFQLPITDLIIPIPGVSGGIELDVQGELGVTYTNDRIVVKPNKTPASGPIQPILQDDAGTTHPWVGGAWAEYLVHPEGTVKYVGTIHLIPEIYLEILGKKFAIPIGFEYPIKIDLDEQKWIFDDTLVHVPFPDIKPPDEKVVHFGKVLVGDEKTISIKFPNIGEAKARVIATAATNNPQFKILDSSAEFKTGESGEIKVRFQPKSTGAASTTLKVETNDPDTPAMEIALDAEGFSEADPEGKDAGPGAGGGPSGNGGSGPEPTAGAGGTKPNVAGAEEAEASQSGSCACRTAGDSSSSVGGFAFVFGIGLFGLRLRQRRRRAPRELS